jgi:hypothetical protein
VGLSVVTHKVFPLLAHKQYLLKMEYGIIEPIQNLEVEVLTGCAAFPQGLLSQQLPLPLFKG